MATKPSIVFCHGLWADGSCFSKLIVPLQAEGYECIAAQYGLNTTAEDVAAAKETIGRVSGPVILVGHSYGGSEFQPCGLHLSPEGDSQADRRGCRLRANESVIMKQRRTKWNRRQQNQASCFATDFGRMAHASAS